MGLYDRDYTRFDYRPPREPGYSFIERIPPVTRLLLIINLAVFLLMQINAIARLGGWFVLDTLTKANLFQLWRFVTYQFLHVDLMHLAVNMIGLFFIGRILESRMGRQFYTIFYLACGIAGGLLYAILCVLGVLKAGVLLGASASLLGLVGACAVMYPKMMVIVIFIPMQMRLLAILSFVFFVLAILFSDSNPGGHAAHLGGLLAGGGYILYRRKKIHNIGIDKFISDFFNYKMPRRSSKSGTGSWEKKLQQRKQLEEQLDQILEKVSRQGIQSLTRSEKAILRKASKEEQKKNKLNQ
ncbi:Rhomboid protease GluP [Limihaloglobus sulfuriphilus]|uniref:Rhomboid protease GluP n=1 Tax=Limihaloglobus sulfuriphilus TaxID=1851148 RepID=A0A1Q2MDF8_9BACT|nr:rhomboid family intramembrane serine protease [Limihaloglobus sulfuriphilus]AQQ70588.1 Rhomboid protease GluP [Limihaloglobus sulfuriphilus]